MLEKIKNYLLIGLAILIIVIGILLYYFYTENKKAQLSITNHQNIETQNSQYQIQIKQKSDSLQLLTGLVINLNGKNTDIKKQWISQVSSLQVQIEDLKAKGNGIESDGKDSVGEFNEVQFSGKKGIAKFNGFTKLYLKLNPVYSIYDLSLDYDTIGIFSSMFKDSLDKWRIKTITNTPGIKLKTDYRIDSTYFSHVNTNQNFADNNKVNTNEQTIGIIVRGGLFQSFNNDSWVQKHPFDVSGEFYYEFLSARYKLFEKVLSVEAYYNINLTKPFKFVEKVFSIF